MRRWNLQPASWLGLIVVSLLLLVVNGGFQYDDAFLCGYTGVPLFDTSFCLFVLSGAVATIEIWSIANPPPKMTLLSLLGTASAICLFCFMFLQPMPPIYTIGTLLWLRLHEVCHYAFIIVFGFAVVGWGKLIGLALKRRS